jgi:catechol 2,3-dioxygenase-like lactoylglutathione lyase family enzyme
MIDGISAVTLGTHEMPRAVRFYRALGFEILHSGEGPSFTSFRAGTSYLNLIAQPAERHWSWWGRVIFYVADVDELSTVRSQRDASQLLRLATPHGVRDSST